MTRWARHMTVGLAALAASPTGNREVLWEETGALGWARFCARLNGKYPRTIPEISHANYGKLSIGRSLGIH